MAIPLSTLPARVSVREVGPRDGLQNEDLVLSTGQKIALINALNQTGLDQIEVGSFVHPDRVPQMADTATVFAQIERRPGVVYSAIAPNLKGAQRAIAAGADSVQVFLSTSESHNQSNVGMSIAQSLAAAADIAATLREAGVAFEAVLSVVFGCPFEGDVPLGRVIEIGERLAAMGATQLTLGDTTGMAHPRLVQAVVRGLQERLPQIPLRLHPHSARGAGLANVLAALEVGIDRVDASIGGIGGCPFAPGAPGNICTEDLVHMLHEMGIATGLKLPRLVECAKMIEGLLGHEVPGQVIKGGICGHLSEGEPRPWAEQAAEIGV
ncbi:MAG TPA: hydroxymethylglutaryl-CoA lyase [Herpetosiphonaceae bacterium]